MKYKLIVLLVLYTSFYQCSEVKDSEEGNLAEIRSEPMEIYLLIGQSNMAGRATIELQDKDSIDNVFLFTGHQKKIWEKAANPLNKYSSVRKKISMQKLGPGYGFAKELAKARSGKKIGLVVNAKGGTSIEEWKPGETLYNEAVSQTKKALKDGVLKGVLWHQGESDALKYQTYMSKIKLLIESLRKDFKAPYLPFVAGQLSPDKPKRNDFNEMILGLPGKVKNTGIISAKRTSTFDRTHFDNTSQRLLGKRYAEELLKLMHSH